MFSYFGNPIILSKNNKTQLTNDKKKRKLFYYKYICQNVI